ncbi:MAG: DUF1846 domain-containing protein [Candidatus Methanogranum gryphiswaldense]|nr:MAG: DUF1846 domain-containing protein [Candidatus Methanogranum sp. U3.2.1]
MKIGFDNEKYLQIQSEHIEERINRFGGKLYLELGGKLFDDYHASRVLPGFKPDSKIKMLLKMKDKVEVIIVINSGDIEKNKVRGDLGTTYDLEVLRFMDAFKEDGMSVAGVVLTMYSSQPSVIAFEERLSILGIRSYRHYAIPGYPSNMQNIVSDEGFGKNEYVKTKRPLIVVTAPGPGSGKMATCLSQMYNEYKHGERSGYAKFETFPIWNMPLRHPVNIAYEAATADLGDVNMIDPFHMEAYQKAVVNYNRDIEAFPVLNAILEKISGTSPYRSPTDMGVNMAGFCIIDDAVVSHAATMEIIRRYYRGLCDNRQGLVKEDVVKRLKLLLQNGNIDPDIRKVIPAVRQKAEISKVPITGVELYDGRIVTGKDSPLLCATSAMLLNAMKTLADIDDSIPLISSDILGPVQKLKVENLGNDNPRLHADEMLVALAVCARNDEMAARALSHLSDLKGCEVHSSVILSQTDMAILNKLKLNVTCEPRYQGNHLFQGQIN